MDAMNNNHKLAERYAKWLVRNKWKVLFGSIISIFLLMPFISRLKLNTSYRVWFNEGSEEVIEYDKFRKRYSQDDVLIIALNTENRAVHLSKLPEKFKIPSSAKNKIEFIEEKNLLFHNGPMEEKVKEELLKQSEDRAYQNAIELLYKRTHQKGVFNNEAISAIQRLTKKFWKTKYVTRVDSITNYSHTYVDGDDLEVKDLILTKTIDKQQFKSLISDEIAGFPEEVLNNKRKRILSDFLSHHLSYKADAIYNYIESKNLDKEKKLDLIAETILKKLPLQKRELHDFLKNKVLTSINDDKKKEEVIQNILTMFFTTEQEVKGFADTVLASKGLFDKFFPSRGELPHSISVRIFENEILANLDEKNKKIVTTYYKKNDEKRKYLLDRHIDEKTQENIFKILDSIKIDKETLIAKEIMSSKLGHMKLIEKYYPYLKTQEMSEFTQKMLWAMPHLAKTFSLEQKYIELKNFLAKLPPKKEELIKILTPYINSGSGDAFLISVLERAFPPYYLDPDDVERWFSSSNFSTKDYTNMVTELFSVSLPLLENEIDDFIAFYLFNMPETQDSHDFVRDNDRARFVKEKILEQIYLTESELKEKEKIALGEKLVRDLLISSDHTTSQIMITPKLPDNSQAKNEDFLKRVKKVLYEEQLKSGYETHVAGLPEMSAAFVHYIGQDMKWLLPTMFGLVILTMLYLFRSFWGTLTPMLVVVLSIIGTLGVAGILAYEENNITKMTPQILMAIGIADAIHILTIFFRELHSGKSKSESVIMTLKMNLLPCFLTSFTTSLGFFSLLTSVSPPIRVLGVMIGVGSFIAFYVTITFLPSILLLLPFKEGKTHHKERALKWTRGLGNFVIEFRLPILVFFTAITVVSIYLTTTIVVDNNPTKYFAKGTYFRDSMDFVDEKLSSAYMMDVTINAVNLPQKIEKGRFENDILAKLKENTAKKDNLLKYYKLQGNFYELASVSDEERTKLIDILKSKPIAYTLPNKADGIKNPELLKEIDKFQKAMEEEKSYKISHSSSLVDILKTVNQRLNKDNPEHYLIPDDKKLVAENLFLYTQSVPFGRDLNNQLSVDQSAMRVTFRRKMTSSEESLKVIEEMKDYLRAHFQGYDYHVTGRAVIFTYTTPKVTRNMVFGIVLALALITIVLTITFKSIKIGLLSIIPNVVPLLIMFGAVGGTNTSFNMGLSMVAVIALGIVVDDTIHFIAKYLSSRKTGKDPVLSVYQVFHDVGSAITFTSIILTIGFGIFILSNFVFNMRFGVFTAFTMAVALFLDLLFLPAILLLQAKQKDIDRAKEDAELVYSHDNN